MLIEAGKLRFRIRFQETPNKDNSFGEQEQKPKTVFETFGNVEPVSANETLRGQAPQLNVTHKVTLRYNPAVKAHHRIAWDDGSKTRYMSIHSLIDVEGKKRALHILATEVVKD